MVVHNQKAEPWKFSLVETGDDTLTDGRLKRVADYKKMKKPFVLTIEMA